MMKLNRLSLHSILAQLAVIVAMITLALHIPAAKADERVRKAFDLLDQKEYRQAYEVAKTSREPYAEELLQWYYMRRVPDDWSAADLERFADKYANWPRVDDIRQAAKNKSLDLTILKKLDPKQLAKKRWRGLHGKVRDAIEAKQYTKALGMLKNHGQQSGVGFAQAEWLTGWVLLEKKNSPSRAYKHFEGLYNGVSYAISRARAAYWAGRAAEALGNHSLATSWYQKAAGFPTTFYGQLAYVKSYPGEALQLPAVSHPSNSEIKQFATGNSLMDVIKLCFKYKQPATLNLFIKHAVLNAKSERVMHLAAAYLGKYQHISSGIKAAKRAAQRNVYLGDIAFPRRRLNPDSRVEPALVHSIIRQESEFNPIIRSHAGAVGLMQLLPSTAKLVAKRLGVTYRPNRITDPEYNIKLGTSYLGQMLDRYNGSYILAVAAYNAGPGNVDKWVKRFGRPSGKSFKSAVNWVEGIPFSETRNYVQRVMENLQVYRQHLGSRDGLQIERDLVR